MPRVIWSPAALGDVHRLYPFLAEKDTDAARRAVAAIRDGLRILAQRPGIGRPVDSMELEYREWLIDFGNSGYVAFYHYDGETAVILAVHHQKEAGYY